MLRGKNKEGSGVYRGKEECFGLRGISWEIRVRN